MDSVDITTANQDYYDQAQLHKLRIKLQSLKTNIPGRTVTKADGSVTHYCIDCGEPIPESRLKAVPNTVRCLDCQSEYERTKI